MYLLILSFDYLCRLFRFFMIKLMIYDITVNIVQSNLTINIVIRASKCNA